MNPEEYELLHHTAKLAEENNRMLKGIRTSMRWGQVWGFVKFLIILVPFIIGYFYLQPYLGSLSGSVKQAQELFKSF